MAQVAKATLVREAPTDHSSLACPECGRAKGPNRHIHHKGFCSLSMVINPEHLIAAIAERETERLLEIDRRREACFTGLTSSLGPLQKFLCNDCGSVVIDRDKHTEHHLKIEETETMVERLIERL